MKVDDLFSELMAEEPDYARLAVDYRDVLSDVIERYDQASNSLKSRIVATIALIDSNESLQLLNSAAIASDELLRLSAILAAGAITEPARAKKVKKLLENALSSDSPLIKTAAVFALKGKKLGKFAGILESLRDNDASTVVHDAVAQVLEFAVHRSKAADMPVELATGRSREILTDFPFRPTAGIIATDTPLPGVQLGQ